MKNSKRKSILEAKRNRFQTLKSNDCTKIIGGNEGENPPSSGDARVEKKV